MKIAFAGKGGTGKTSIAAWTADYLARCGQNVWLIDADTALSLGSASGLPDADLPIPLSQRKDLINEYIGQGLLNLTPDVQDLPEKLAVTLPPSQAPLLGETKKRGTKQLLLMGGIAGAGSGCACEANALLKALLAHLVYERSGYVLVDLEAGVEHLGRGTVAEVDALVIVSEPSARSLNVARSIHKMASELGLKKQTLVLNRSLTEPVELPERENLPASIIAIPELAGLKEKMLFSGSVLDLPEQAIIDNLIKQLLQNISKLD